MLLQPWMAFGARIWLGSRLDISREAKISTQGAQSPAPTPRQPWNAFWNPERLLGQENHSPWGERLASRECQVWIQFIFPHSSNLETVVSHSFLWLLYALQRQVMCSEHWSSRTYYYKRYQTLGGSANMPFSRAWSFQMSLHRQECSCHTFYPTHKAPFSSGFATFRNVFSFSLIQRWITSRVVLIPWATGGRMRNKPCAYSHPLSHLPLLSLPLPHQSQFVTIWFKQISGCPCIQINKLCFVLPLQTRLGTDVKLWFSVLFGRQEQP